ncbi:hypothetical protein [Mycobacterium sp.]|uniref:hypothetical protein n=1 Tax=Mycobacterium sp. TaxID=1785 RepID=UPI003F95AE33
MPAAVQTVGSGSSPADIAKVLNEDGRVVIADLAAPETMDQIRAELEPHLAATTEPALTSWAPPPAVPAP